MEHHKADVWQVPARGAAGDDVARFLRELRQLRDGAGLGHAELAARAHYPYDLIVAAEAGPALPDLPVLSAYVRGCGGTAEEWEERWRRLTRTPSLPVSASRHAGNSAAATAGARIGAVTQVVDAPDPSVIIAALNRVAEGMAVGGSDLDAPLTVPPRPAYPGDDLPAGVSAADVLLPDVLLPEIPVPDDLLPEVSVPDLSVPDVPAPEAPVPHGLLPEVSVPDLSVPDPSVPDAPVPHGLLPEASAPDLSVPDLSLPDPSAPDLSVPEVSASDVSLADSSMPDVFAVRPVPDPVIVPADLAPVTPAAPADEPLVTPADAWPDAPAAESLTGSPAPTDSPAESPTAGAAEPEAPSRPRGWDPIRVSAAWPAISSEDPRRTRVSDDTSPMNTPPWDPASAVAATNATPSPVVRQSAWASGKDAFGEPTGVARPGSRARTLMVVVVLVCVLAVVLAIFA